VLSRNNTPGYALVALIQDTLAGGLAAKVPLTNINPAIATTLAHELRTGQSLPRNLALDFSPLLDLLKLPTLTGAPLVDENGQLDLTKLVSGLLDPGEHLKGILLADSPAEAFNRIRDFFHRRPDLSAIFQSLGSFVEGQFGIALSLITTLRNLLSPNFPQAVLDAQLQYFFGENGFVTVDEISISPPMQLSGDPKQLSDLRTLFSEKTGERFLRDMITITVEAAGDVQYDLRNRYARMATILSAAQLKTARRWMKGFATMAESGVTAAVEESILGVSQLQTNALIAASAGTYAGTVSRKATQHVFLSELDLEQRQSSVGGTGS
jgi:hypothetical protein